MTPAPATGVKADRLFWIKYNPTEWLGMYPELTDEEYGLFHRVIAKLWAIPGNRLSREDLLTELRVKPGSRRDKLITALTGYALKVGDDGRLFVPAIDEAFADAIRRGRAGTAGADARWNKPKTPQAAPAPAPGNPVDF
jgi:hypothetical protein